MYLDFLFLVTGKGRIKSLTANFVEFRGRDGKLLGAHYVCPMQIRLKTSLRPSSTTYFFSLFVSLPHCRERDHISGTENNHCIQNFNKEADCTIARCK